MTDSRDTVGIDPQKGRKPSATPAGVARIDLAEDGPAMAGAGGPDVDYKPSIEHDEPASALGDPAEIGPADRPAVPGAE